jgi:tRNA(Ile2) C34 agmatinyltransferase TiaS
MSQIEEQTTFPLFKDLICPKCGYAWNSLFRGPMKYRCCPACRYSIKVNIQ